MQRIDVEQAGLRTERQVLPIGDTGHRRPDSDILALDRADEDVGHQRTPGL